MSDSPVKKIRVLVVDDSDFQRGLIVGVLETDAEIEIIGQASDGIEAIQKTLELKPDVITMDIKMPNMDGLTAIREIMAEKPTPILVVSVAIRDEQQFAFQCLKNGALDFVPITAEAGIAAEELIAKVKMCSRIKVVTHPRLRKPSAELPIAKKVKRYEIVGIGISTGGPPALQEVFSGLPKDFPLPIVIVQHISEGFVQGLAEWLNDQCNIEVVEARDREDLKPAKAYLAPTGRHITIEKDRRIRLVKKDFPKCYYKPSADILLESIARNFGPTAIGIIMTGMGRDGVAGIKAINQAGGFTIAQNEQTSVIYGMNKAAIDEGSVNEVLPLDQIAKALAALTNQKQ